MKTRQNDLVYISSLHKTIIVSFEYFTTLSYFRIYKIMCVSITNIMFIREEDDKYYYSYLGH